MEKQNLVGNLPKFGIEEVMPKVCETCQLGEQARHLFLAQTIHIAKIIRAMLNEKNLPNYFWAKVVTIIVYIMIRTLTTTIHGITPKERFTSKTH
jgi:hypothetical protein